MAQLWNKRHIRGAEAEIERSKRRDLRAINRTEALKSSLPSLLVLVFKNKKYSVLKALDLVSTLVLLFWALVVVGTRILDRFALCAFPKQNSLKMPWMVLPFCPGVDQLKMEARDELEYSGQDLMMDV